VYSILDQEERSFDLDWSSPNNNLSFSTNIISNSFIYTQSSALQSLSYKGRVNTYSGGGYVFEMKENLFNTTKYLNKLKWIDSQTSALFVEFTLFNPNINLFVYCSILFEIASSGSFINTNQFNSIDLYTINQSQYFSFKLALGIIFMIFMLALFVIEVVKFFQLKGFNYFLQPYNYIDLALISFSWAAFSMFLYRLYASYEIDEKIHRNEFKFSFISFQYLSYCNECLSYFLGICTACATLRLVKVLRFTKRIIIFLKAFTQSLGEIITMSIIFIITWMAFVQVFYLLMNDESVEFSSLLNSMETCFTIILGKFDSKVFLESKSSFFASLFFVGYNIVILFVFINLLVAILIESLHAVQNDAHLDDEDPDLYLYLKTMFGSQLWILIKTIGINRRINEPDESKLRDDSKETILERFNKLVIRLKKVFFFSNPYFIF
jgi:hypothetical protein